MSAYAFTSPSGEPYKAVIRMVSISQTGELRHGEVKELIRGYEASNRRSWALNPGAPATELVSITTMC